MRAAAQKAAPAPKAGGKVAAQRTSVHKPLISARLSPLEGDGLHPVGASATFWPPQRPAAMPQHTNVSSRAGPVLQRKCACGGSSTGECEACKGRRLQTKLTIGSSNDPMEREADRVAEHVMAKPASQAVTSAPLSIQRFAGQANANAGTAPASVDRALAGPGRPMGHALRQDMGQRFGYDFSAVRIHTGAEAAQSARDVSAHAYTLGDNIVFGAGKFAPGSNEGRTLIAHELTHVVQQKGAEMASLHRQVKAGKGDDGASIKMRHTAGEAGKIQRAGPASAPPVSSRPPATCAPPPTMLCNPALDNPAAVTNTLLFPRGVSALNATQRAEIDATADAWHKAYSSMTVRIDGYASAVGDCTDNWNLSCRRAQEIAHELESPRDGSPGVPHGNIRVFAHGESNDAGPTLGLNQNASISIPTLPVSAPTPAPAPPLLGPEKPLGSPRDFCVPYTTPYEVAEARMRLHFEWIGYVRVAFGSTVANLWTTYLLRHKGDSLARTVFAGSGDIETAFKDAPETVADRDQVFNDTAAAMRLRPEATAPLSSLGGTPYMSAPIPLSLLLPVSALSRIIDYGSPATSIPGNLAGGTSRGGRASSDAGLDQRLISGNARIWRNMHSSGEVKVVFIDLDYEVLDCIDFCPGAWGDWVAQRYTIPMSRLEATPWAPVYDLPFEVDFHHSGARTL